MAEDDDNCIVRGFMGDDVLLNGWMFCRVHSLEYCDRCCRDHRSTNNVQFEDDLTEDQYNGLTDYGINDLADRRALKVKGLWKQLKGDKTACVKHSKVGCQQCFNFKQMIIGALPAGEAEQTSNSKHRGRRSGAADTAVASSTAADTAGSAAATSAMQTPQTPSSGAGKEKKRRECWACGVQPKDGSDTKLKQCSDCKRAVYCSRDCQIKDYKAHKPQCKQWKTEMQVV